jgi:hypothetical protein
MQVYFLIGTTPATPNTEFSLCITWRRRRISRSVLPLQSVNITNPCSAGAPGRRQPRLPKARRRRGVCVMVEA